MSDKQSSSPRPKGFPIAVVIVGIIAIAFAWMIRSQVQPAPSEAIGQPFPAIQAVGWINGSAPAEGELTGQVLVVDAWAYWCGPCRAVTPTLVQLHEKYKDRGVRFIGLTSEGFDSESLKRTVDTIHEEKVTWPNAYGADKTLTDLKVDRIPQLWVVDGQNKIVFHQRGWSSTSTPNLEQAIVEALKSVKAPPTTAAPAKQGP